MTDDEILLSHARDLKKQCADRGMITHTAFLNLHQRSLLASIERENSADVQTFYHGGCKDAERVLVVFVPKFYGVGDLVAYLAENPDDDPLCLLRAEKDVFSTLSHRDCLGALMGLGIKREQLGDILVDDGGAYLVCLKTIRPFLLEHFSSAGRATLTLRDASLDELHLTEAKTEDVFVSVPSLRLDCVVAAAYKLSRGKAEAAIQGGLAYVNAVLCDKPDKKLSVGDKLVLRGKGKCLLFSQTGESKKGRLHLTIRRYL